MRKLVPVIVAVLIIGMLLPLGFFYTVSRPPAVPPETIVEPETIRPASIFDGEAVYTDGSWFLLPDGRLSDITDGRVYLTDLDFAPFERIETDGDKFLLDGMPFTVYHTKVYPQLAALNAEYQTLKARFPDVWICVLSNLHMTAVSGGQLYTFNDDGNMSVIRVDWELYGDDKTLFEQICLFYDYPGEFFRDDRYFVFDGGGLRCFSITFGELDIS